MHRIRFHAKIFSLALSVLLGLHAGVRAHAPAYKPQELLVKFRSQISAATEAGLQNAVETQQATAIGLGKVHRITLPRDVSVAQAITIYANHPDVLFAEPNYSLQPQMLPNDPDLDQQWGLHNIGQLIEGYVGRPGADLDANLAWDIARGSDTVVVAVLDTGCDYSHPELVANMWRNTAEIAGNGLDDDNNGFVDDYWGWDFSDNDDDPQDAAGHGTHIAGIIAAQGNNNIGISGVAWQTRILPVRFINAFDVGYTADAIAAIQYAVARGAKIINCSWGGSDYSTALRDEIANTDALFICAAGNLANNTDITAFYPAAYDADNIIAVAASDQMDRLTYFSNFGPTSVDVAAPGIRIYGLQNGRNTIWQDDFNDQDMDGWTTGGDADSWGVADPPGTTDAPALAVSPGLDYANNANMWAQLPNMDLSLASAPLLDFNIIGLSESNADYLYLEASVDGIHWSLPPQTMGNAILSGGISGTIPYWMPLRADMNPWEGESQLQLRLRFQSDDSTTQRGFFLDNFELTSAGTQETYTYKDGTSMAAAFVSGVAALLLSQDPELTVLDLKTIIEASVDVDLDLMDQVASGGRINALNALTLLEDLSLSATTAAADRIALSWTALAPLDSQVIIERRAKGQTDFETVAQVSATATAYEDISLAPDSTYYYRVYADTQDGRSGYSNQTLATTLAQTGGSSSSGGGSSGGCFIYLLTR